MRDERTPGSLTELRRFALEDGSDLANLVEGLGQRAPFERDPDRSVERTVYDTFDWRLHREQTVLELERPSATPRRRRGAPERTWLVWRSTVTGDVLGRIAVDAVPRFVRDLPAGPATERLAELVEMRALLPLATIVSHQSRLRLLDAEGKTQARVLVDRASVQPPATRLPGSPPAVVPGSPPAVVPGSPPAVVPGSPPAVVPGSPPAVVPGSPPAVVPGAADRSGDGSPGPLPTVVEVVPVRGYPRAADRVTELLAAQVVLRPVADDVVGQALAAVGLTPGDYSSKLRLRLDPTGHALDVVVEVLSTLLATMVANEPGTRADTDSEYLHDFRVAVRRSRSVLGMARRVVPPELLEHLRGEFKWLGDITTPTRDFDVYLLTYPDFEASLPEKVRPDLAPLRSFLVEHQVEAHRELVARLDSPRYADLLERYRSWLAAPRDEPGAGDADLVPDAERPAVEFAAARTWKAYRRVVRDGRRIDHDSPPERLHDLRKDAKKLRYALECFAGLFPAEQIAPLVKELKGVQDVLGEFQDCEVQKGSLRGFGERMVAEEGPAAAPALMAMGYLVEQLDARERRARDQFLERFAHFDAHHQRHRFRHLFAPAPEESPA